MADVSGYTALSERYNNTGKGGTYRLTVTLNTYLGSLIEMIYSHGGDVIKFAGDAFLALWKTDKRTFLCHTIHTAITCALIIQHSYSSYETDVKVNLKVKLAIAAGNLLFAPIGTGIDMNYVLFGLPVDEAKAAESMCASGEVILTPTAWGHCYSRNYDYIINNNGFVTLKGILYDPRDSDVTKPFVGFGSIIRQLKKSTAIENLPDNFWDTNEKLSEVEILRKNETLSLRKTILTAEKRNIGSEIRKFMIRPILTQIDAHQPLEYLTEMRQISVLFTTLKPVKCPFTQLITIVNNAYQITCEIVYKSMGCVNKIILFDKDVMMLIIFGLRGFKHESEAQAALKCAFDIKKSVIALDGVQEVSIGVTTGQVYCGVVGHPLRREFTVIGAIVNKAARLMCYYRNKITCDETTFMKSKMSSNAFILQSKIELKGIQQPGKIYEYLEEIRSKELNGIPLILPLLNRSDEMEYYQTWLDESHLSYRDFDALLLIGESRIGKTRTLEWMARYAKKCNYHVSYVNLTSVHSANPYLALSQIFNQMLDLEEPIVGFEKEEKIVQLIKVYNEDLCFLNKILKARFAYQEKIQSINEEKRQDKAKQVFMRLINAVSITHVIFLDDLQNLDVYSWEFITLMLSSTKIYSVFSVTRGKFSTVQNWLYDIFTNDNIRKMMLGPLSSQWIAPLACQILDVHSVPNDLCNALRVKCKGMPGLVESFIIHLFSSGALEMKKIHDDELEIYKAEELQFPDTDLLQPQALNIHDQTALDQIIENDTKEYIDICVVIKKEELNTNINEQNIDALIMIQIDSLTPYQQLLLKIASVIGNVVSRVLLESIMYNNNLTTTAKAIKRLFALRILSCANVNTKLSFSEVSSNKQPFKRSQQANLICNCKFEYDPEINDNLPKYAFCKVMRFKNKNSRKTCYELLPINQKKEFHARIVKYLENNRQVCEECGGNIMIVQSHSYVSPDEDYRNSYDENNSENEGSINSEASITHRTSTRSEEVNFKKTYSASGSLKYDNTNREFMTSRTISQSSLQNGNINKMNYTPILKTNCTDSQEQSRKRVTISKLKCRKTRSSAIEIYKIFDKLRDVTAAVSNDDWQNLGSVDSQDMICSEKLYIKIEKGVSMINFQKCTCADLKITIGEQLIYHAFKSEMKTKTIEFLLNYCYVSLLANSVDIIFPKLEMAEKLCLECIDINKFDKKRFLGKLYALRAGACLLTGNLAAAKLNVERACQIYKINLFKASSFFNKIISESAFKSLKGRLHDKIMKSESVFCLNVATLLYSALGEEGISRTAAYKALAIVQCVQCSAIDLCDAYSNAIQVELDRGTPENTDAIEKIASQSLSNLSRPFLAEELFAVGKLFSVNFKARMARGHLMASIRSGFRALTVSRFLQAHHVSLDIIPDLFYALLSRRRINEAIDIVQLITRLGNISLESETWYYALCMDMILDTGFALETPLEISRFAEYAIEKGKSAGPSRRRLVVGLWTYWLRLDVERKVKRFESEALSWSHCETDDGTLTTLISAMRLAEGMLESLAKKVNDLRKIVDLMELRSIADRELLESERDVRIMRIIYPRWLLLRANSLKISGRHLAANNLINQALEESRRMYNRLEEGLAQATLSKSVFWIQNARTGLFIDWREGVERAKTSWHQIMYKMTTTNQII